MTRSVLVSWMIRLVGAGVSATVAWQAVRYYRGQVTIPGYDTFFAMLAMPGTAPGGAGLFSLLQTVTAVLQVSFGILMVLVIAVQLMDAFDRLALRVLLGPVACRAPRSSEHNSAAVYAQQSLKTNDPDAPAAATFGWFDALIWSPVTLGIFSVVVLAIVAVAQKLDSERMALGISWFSVGDTVVISFAVAVWIAGASALLRQCFRIEL